MHNLKELKIWQKAVDLATEVYQLTAGFSKEEKYGLLSLKSDALPSLYRPTLPKEPDAIQKKSLFIS
jgi:hypothetical protein